MRVIKIKRDEPYWDVTVFGLPLGRLLGWTLTIAVAHRLICIALPFVAFVVGFSRGGRIKTIWEVQTALDFPIIFLHHFGLIHADFISGSGFLEPLGTLAQPAWSLALGVTTAVIICRHSGHKQEI